MAETPPPTIDLPPLRPLLLTVHEAGILLGCDDAATWRLIRQKVIPARRLGSRVLVPREQLEELIRRLPPYPGSRAGVDRGAEGPDPGGEEEP
jgi:excisionase family DNA binding protein